MIKLKYLGSCYGRYGRPETTSVVRLVQALTGSSQQGQVIGWVLSQHSQKKAAIFSQVDSIGNWSR
ncbi:MAG TPA: hypothetical protein PKD69_08105 [Elusimicrobiota bacterium]|nr:hypothetical protein [Elusimicrobiota bacterium]